MTKKLYLMVTFDDSDAIKYTVYHQFKKHIDKNKTVVIPYNSVK